MISPISRTKDWIDQCRNNLDPALTEKMIMALILVEELTRSGLDFIFKGGTAVSLITASLKRFSIDVDVIVKPRTDIEPYLQKVMKGEIFIHWNEDKRESQIPKKHYRIFFNSNEGSEKFILLDVLYEENPYPKIIPTQIISPLLKMDGEAIKTICPSPESILGDKLTAYAPHTTGIQFGKEKELEFLKQLFDINTLFDYCIKRNIILENVFQAHSQIAKKELIYRGLNKKSIHDVLSDTFETSCMIGTYGKLVSEKEFEEITRGVSSLRQYCYPSGSISLEQIILCAAKTAYLAAVGLSGTSKIHLFDPNLEEKPRLISNPHYSKLNRVIHIGVEPFFYFSQAVKLLGLFE